MTAARCALVTDVHLRNAVAGLRCLGRAGIPVVAASDRRGGAGLWSRYAEARVMTPSVLEAPVAFAHAIAHVAEDRGPLVVYPGREEALDALLTLPQRAPGLILPYPPPDVLSGIRHKPSLEPLARGVGLSSPRTIAEATVEELVAGPPPSFPCVVKEARPGGSVELTSAIDSAAEFTQFLDRLPPGQRLLVQERVDGALVGLSLVLDRRGGIAAAFQQRTERTWPERAGGSSLARSVPLDQSLLERSSRMLAETGYWGLAQLQFIEGAEGHALIDINPRFYGTLPLAFACGVNLPRAWHAITLGEHLAPPAPYRIGLTYRWLEADVSAALQGIGRRRLCTRGKADSGAMWARDDMLPSAFLTAQAVTERVDRLILRRAAAAFAHRAGAGLPPA